jgi:hypothetical protein
MAKYTPPVTAFLSTEEREDWNKTKKQFFIVDVTYGDSKFGKKAYTYTLRYTDKKTGEVSSHFLSLSENPRRAAEANWLQRELVNDPTGVGPCILGKVPTDYNNDAWVFEAAE